MEDTDDESEDLEFGSSTKKKVKNVSSPHLSIKSSVTMSPVAETSSVAEIDNLYTQMDIAGNDSEIANLVKTLSTLIPEFKNGKTIMFRQDFTTRRLQAILYNKKEWVADRFCNEMILPEWLFAE